ncbi:hypothetical protein [Streptomyces sp. NPDC058625]|uniref:hypothetical protein n=1 Tax=Streptomyces sp. NPDC058625 TaxID=3346564 RepID=UPI00365C20FE
MKGTLRSHCAPSFLRAPGTILNEPPRARWLAGHFGGNLIRTQSIVDRALAKASNAVERTLAWLVMTLVRRSGRRHAGPRAQKWGLTWPFPGLTQADIFPMTSHVECVAILEKAAKDV